jgi:hypothetical protein
MLGVIQLKLTQLLEYKRGFHMNWVNQFGLNFHPLIKPFNSF